MSGVALRLLRGVKIVREWDADIPLDDHDALARAFVAAVRAVTGARSDTEADAFIRDYRLEYYARVGGWTRFSPRKGT